MGANKKCGHFLKFSKSQISKGNQSTEHFIQSPTIAIFMSESLTQKVVDMDQEDVTFLTETFTRAIGKRMIWMEKGATHGENRVMCILDIGWKPIETEMVFML